MKQYLLSVCYPAGGTQPPPDALPRITRDVRAIHTEMQSAGVVGVRRWVASANTATVLRQQGGEIVTTDGPFIESKEQIGGISIIKAPDLDAALGWGAQAGARHRRSDRGASVHGEPLKAEIERVFRHEYGRAVAVLVRSLGDIALAEEAVQDAFSMALERWPGSGVPPAPAGWIITTARNRAIDRLRREATRDQRHAAAMQLAEPDEIAEHDVRDDQLRLIFTCCHPALADEARRRADAEVVRRAVDRGDRARLPGARAHHGAAPDARQGEDPRRRHSLSHPGSRRTSQRAWPPCWPWSTWCSTRATAAPPAIGSSARNSATRRFGSAGCCSS